jgi:hypothetical protein
MGGPGTRSEGGNEQPWRAKPWPACQLQWLRDGLDGVTRVMDYFTRLAIMVALSSVEYRLQRSKRYLVLC